MIVVIVEARVRGLQEKPLLIKCDEKMSKYYARNAKEFNRNTSFKRDEARFEYLLMRIKQHDFNEVILKD